MIRKVINKLILKRLFFFPIKEKIIAIVYYVYINPNKDWQKFILNQLGDIEKTKILNAADLYIEISNPSNVPGVESFFKKIDFTPKDIKLHKENKFEYWGIKRIWDIAQENKNYKYMVYIHTKGITYKDSKRDLLEEVLTYYTFNKWKFFVKTLEKDSNINKIGLFPACRKNTEGKIIRAGWVWYNFWWAKADYIRTLKQPLINSDRYYYESWLSNTTLNNENYNDNFSIYEMTKASYTQQEAVSNAKKLIKNYEYYFK